MRVHSTHAKAPYLALREVHYDEDCRPKMYSEDDATFVTEDAEDKTEILSSLSRAVNNAIQHPILDEREFEKPIGERPQCPRSS
jgi:hypothetical protein